MKKALALLVLGVFLPCLAMADGMAHFRPSSAEAWSLAGETEQSAVIHHRDGRQAMLLSIGLDKGLRGGTTVWIFPIPSKPEKVVLDILKGRAWFGGYDIESKVEIGLSRGVAGMAGYATFPLSLPFTWIFAYHPSPYASMKGALGEPEFSVKSDVVVHQRISKEGLTTDLITTKDPDALARYLSDRGLDLPASSVAVLEWYVGKDYSLVVSYADGPGTADGSADLSLFVSFPAERIFFPLKPTGVYGRTAIPITLLVVGHVSPDPFPALVGNSEIIYLSGHLELDSGLEAFWLGRKGAKARYFTEISINTWSVNLKDDLWIENTAPPRIRVLRVVAGNLTELLIILYLAFSMLASLAAAKLSFRKPPMPSPGMLAHGLWNGLTMLAFVPATRLLKTRSLPRELEAEIVRSNARATVKDRRKIAYVVLFYAFFLAMTAGAALLFKLILR